ncbi:radical SAM domain-containing protein [Methylophaga lonarensis MPL]|uniref:Radical SAM domain-containing protein n=1 Tax=Methylophaga lonarensis MPL TaxID=1286106 RepID=M7NT70_9GAMM|nr:B12-binding domain-containing radical SAM protein [Methylophaga lonarensis]EMR11978.1 radical SAM domain-containing protein [Methylophaga lonarensis MPL]
MRVLIVDLNNFSRYPTLSVGYLTSVLRQHGHDVEVLSPLARGVSGYPRLTRARRRELFVNYLKFWTAVSRNRFIRASRRKLQGWHQPGNDDDQQVITDYFKEMLSKSPDIVLISAYTMYFDITTALAKAAKQRDIPVMVGGSAFVYPEIARKWQSIPGVSAVFAGEPENNLPELIEAIISQSARDKFQGLLHQDSTNYQPAAPLYPLDQLPFPDFSDFPWQAYPNRVIPIMTGRGCEWDICSFCSDVVSASGRHFRSRSLQNVIDEMRFQHSQFNSELFVFLDLKLNSDLSLWRGLIAEIPKSFPKAQWTASLHVDTRADNGLSRQDLQQAAKAGLSRITCGFESGSPDILKKMAKGIKLDRLSAFLQDAHHAGISVRLTAIIGYPGETASDIALTTAFVNAHRDYIERIMLNRFTLMPGTPVADMLTNTPEQHPEFTVRDLNTHSATIDHHNQAMNNSRYQFEVFRLMAAVHKVNRKPLKASAREFEGVM